MPQTAGGLGDRRVSGLVRVRTGLPITGYPNQNDPLVSLRQDVVAQTPPLQGAGPEILDDHVRLVDEIEKQGPSRLGPQIQRDGLLIARVHRPKHVMSVDLGLPPCS
ncbi:Uncharacterised protein [Mycobacteroides abscessus subsp. abscessus]|nr:Uncharacterised protein [Mycobacteroides abscessus subsp. abscessus]